VRQEQTQSQEAQATEQLAMLALTSQVAGNTMTYEVASLPRSGYALPSDFGYDAESANAAVSAKLAPAAVPASARPPPEARLFGPALPGLVFCSAVAAGTRKFQKIRASLVGGDRVVLDVAALTAGAAVLARLAML
jgi:hypothetical protein